MTVIESIISFLQGYDQEVRIGIDRLESQTVSYSLMKAPQENVERFVSGTEVHTDHYQLMARMDAVSEAERIKNNAWGQDIAEWIYQRSSRGEYPELNGYKCTDFGVSTPFFMGSTPDNASAVYQMTVFVKYVKEKKS